jgi:hypothetical protein
MKRQSLFGGLANKDATKMADLDERNNQMYEMGSMKERHNQK